MKILSRIAPILFAFSITSSITFSITVPSAFAGRDLSPTKRRPLRGDTIRFVYRTYEGDLSVTCPHRLQSPDSPYDWKVECFDGSRKFADYTAHVALTQYDRATDPKLAIELLYWVTGTNLPSEVGSTTWIYLGEKTPLRSVEVSETVEHGTAGLYLEIGPTSMRLSDRTR